MSSYGNMSPPVGGDVNKGTALLVVIVISFVLAILSVSGRMAVRVFIVRSVGWDDWTMILAAVSLPPIRAICVSLIHPEIAATISTAFNLEYLHDGGGRHQFYLSAAEGVDASKWSTLANLPFILATTLTKISICVMIVRITTSKHIKRALWVVVGLLVAINGACFIVIVGECRPIAAVWDYSLRGDCWSHNVLMSFALVQFSKYQSPDPCQHTDPCSLLDNHRPDLHLATYRRALEHQDQQGPEDRDLWANRARSVVSTPVSAANSC